MIMITRNGYTKLNRSQISIGLIEAVGGKLLDTDRYIEARTIMDVILMVIRSSKLFSYALT